MISMALRDTFIQACNSNDLEEVRKCLSKGVDVNTVDIDLGSGLSIAAFHNNLALVDLLLAHPDIDVNLEDDNDDSPLSVAMNKDHQEPALVLDNFDIADAKCVVLFLAKILKAHSSINLIVFLLVLCIL